MVPERKKDSELSKGKEFSKIKENLAETQRNYEIIKKKYTDDDEMLARDGTGQLLVGKVGARQACGGGTVPPEVPPPHQGTSSFAKKDI